MSKTLSDDQQGESSLKETVAFDVNGLGLTDSAGREGPPGVVTIPVWVTVNWMVSLAATAPPDQESAISWLDPTWAEEIVPIRPLQSRAEGVEVAIG
jgi:hypothetical protein